MKFLNAFKNVDLGSEALLKVAEIILVLVIGYFVIRTVIHFERKALRKTDRIDNSAVVMILRITRGLLWLMLILTIMSRLNVNMAPFVAVLGTVGAAIALALKDSLANVAGGIILLLTKPFVSGDEIQVAGYSGVVDYIDLMDTKLHTYAYEDVIIPNGTITNSVIVNCSRRDIRRVDGNFWIGLQSDITEAEKILKTIPDRVDILLRDPEPYISIIGSSPDGIEFKACYWCRTEQRSEAKTMVEKEVRKAFEEAGIQPPVRRSDVRIMS